MVNAKAEAQRGKDDEESPPRAKNKKSDTKGKEVKEMNAEKQNNNLNKEQSSLQQIRSSFHDLVIYNEQGQPYLDVNRLVYKPKKK